MSLDQDEIDRLLRLKEELDTKTQLAQTAKEKIATIYQEVTDMTLDSELNNRDEIVSIVSLIESFMTKESRYYEDVQRLIRSILKKGWDY